ncbi:S1C family serine protease [Parafilimonas sp.]|uniref:S1C family serine protease n=1 Tax=Parafilimonas sp. TaxID=1969739 RepID=UPI0039E25933
MKLLSACIIAFAISLLIFFCFMKLGAFQGKEGGAPVSRNYSKFAGYFTPAENSPDGFTAATAAAGSVVHVWVKSRLADNGLYIEESERISGSGSGVIISRNGFIITNNHVVKDASSVRVTLPDRRLYDAELVGIDAAHDLALLKINQNNLDAIPFGNSDVARVGDWVLAIGYPWSLDETITAGIISAKPSQTGSPGSAYIQTDAVINFGSSGGALVNTNGELVGINTAIISPTAASIGYGFAMPANTVYNIIKSILKKRGIKDDRYN